MKTFLIKVGTEFNTEEGVITIASINETGLCCGSLEIYDLDGNIEKTESVQLTKSDIESRLHEYTGINHKAIIER